MRPAVGYTKRSPTEIVHTGVDLDLDPAALGHLHFVFGPLRRADTRSGRDYAATARV